MTRVHWRSSAWPTAFAVLVSSSCSAPTLCPGDARSSPAAGVQSAPLSSSVLLSNVGDSVSFALDVALAGLPELWPAGSAIAEADLGVGVSLAYTTPPVGGDGNTQMPRVRVSLDQRPSTVTSSFTSGFESTHSALFDDCNLLYAAYCCAFGSKECQARLRVNIERLDGAPFPPVQVTWIAGATATIDSCPRDLDTPTLTVTSEAP